MDWPNFGLAGGSVNPQAEAWSGPNQNLRLRLLCQTTKGTESFIRSESTVNVIIESMECPTQRPSTNPSQWIHPEGGGRNAQRDPQEKTKKNAQRCAKMHLRGENAQKCTKMEKKRKKMKKMSKQCTKMRSASPADMLVEIFKTLGA